MTKLKLLNLKFVYLFSSLFSISYFLDNQDRSVMLFKYQNINCFEIDAMLETIALYSLNVTVLLDKIKAPISIVKLCANKIWPKYKQLYWKAKYEIEI